MKTNVQWRRRTGWGLLALVIAWGLFQGFRPQPVGVDVGSAGRGALRVVLEQEGRTRVLDRYVVAAPVAGYARRIHLDIGQAVERGALLAELEPMRAEGQARIGAAQASVSVTEQRSKAAASSADLAQAELQRTRALRLQGHVSAAGEDRVTSEAQRSAAELRSAQFAVASARHELEAARTTLRFAGSASSHERVAVRSPVDGRVPKIAHKSEGPVSNGPSLVEIGDPGALEVEVDLLSFDAVRIHPGTRVVFERWGGDGVLEGLVRVIGPAGFTKVSALGVEEQRVRVIVAFTSPASQWQRLGDGYRYRVEASFIVWEAQDILQIPASALFRDGDGWVVFVVAQGKAVKRRVEVGQRTGLNAQIASGIQMDERVINHPDDRVREGVSVVAR